VTWRRSCTSGRRSPSCRLIEPSASRWMRPRTYGARLVGRGRAGVGEGRRRLSTSAPCRERTASGRAGPPCSSRARASSTRGARRTTPVASRTRSSGQDRDDGAADRPAAVAPAGRASARLATSRSEIQAGRSRLSSSSRFWWPVVPFGGLGRRRYAHTAATRDRVRVADRWRERVHDLLVERVPGSARASTWLPQPTAGRGRAG